MTALAAGLSGAAQASELSRPIINATNFNSGPRSDAPVSLAKKAPHDFFRYLSMAKFSRAREQDCYSLIKRDVKSWGKTRTIASAPEDPNLFPNVDPSSFLI